MASDGAAAVSGSAEDLFNRLMGGTQRQTPDAAPADESDVFSRLMAAPLKAPEPAQPAPPGVEPATRWSRFQQGAGDMLHGGAQMLARSLPDSAVGAVNDATAWVNRQPGVGPVTRALGMTPATPQQLDQRVADREQQYQASRQAGGSTGMDWMRMGGNVAAGLPMALATTPGTLMGAAAAGAGTGALQGALQPVAENQGEFWGQKADQAVGGAVGGAAGGAGGHFLGRLLSPQISPQVRTLQEAGVEMTPGQIIGGFAQRAENKATSLPLVGDAVTSAQRRSIESFNRATANRVLQPLNAAVPDELPAGREMVNFVEDQIGRVYADTAARTRPFGPDAAFAQDIGRVSQQFMTPESRATFARLVGDRVVSRFQNGPIDGGNFKTIDAELGTIAREFSASATVAEREVARGVRGVQQALRDLMARTNPDVAPDIRAADQAFARFVRMEGAAAGQGATEGVFTPAQLSSAVRAADRTPRHSGYAGGDALMQDLSDAGRTAMAGTPNSFTADRLMNTLGLGALATGQVPPELIAGGAAAGMLYSRPGARLAQSVLTTPRTGALAPVGLLGDAMAQGGGAGAVPLGALLLEPPPRRPQQAR